MIFVKFIQVERFQLQASSTKNNNCSHILASFIFDDIDDTVAPSNSIISGEHTFCILNDAYDCGM